MGSNADPLEMESEYFLNFGLSAVYFSDDKNYQ